MTDNVVQFKRPDRNKTSIEQLVTILTDGLVHLTPEMLRSVWPPLCNDDIQKYLFEAWINKVKTMIIILNKQLPKYHPGDELDVALMEMLNQIRLGRGVVYISMSKTDEDDDILFVISLQNYGGIYIPINGWVDERNIHMGSIETYARHHQKPVKYYTRFFEDSKND